MEIFGATCRRFSKSCWEGEGTSGAAELGSCPTDATRRDRFRRAVRVCRYADARTIASTITAARCLGGFIKTSRLNVTLEFTHRRPPLSTAIRDGGLAGRWMRCHYRGFEVEAGAR